METMSLVWHLIVLLICLIFSAFFSASETALLSLPKAKIFRLADELTRGKLIRKAVSQPDRLLGAILLGNNLFNVAGSAVGTSIFLQYWGETGLIGATLVLTGLFLIFAEVTPKTLAAFQPEKLSLFVIRPLNLFLFIFGPVVALLSSVSRLALKLAKSPSDPEEMVTREEFVTLVQSGRKEGYLGRIEQRMLKGVLELSDINLGEVMIPLSRVKSFEQSLTVGQVREMVEEWPYSRYPVYKDESENISGYIHLRDLMTTSPSTSLVEIVHPCYFVPESRTVQGQLGAFRKEQIHLAFVVDEFGRVVGMVTMEDVLEEIVGEIVDEFDTSYVGIVPMIGGSHIVDGRLTVREVNRLAGRALPEGPYHTISGLIQTLAQKIPNAGEEYSCNDLTLKVIDMDGKAVDRVMISSSKH